jgi:hypothetical protein
MDYRYVNTNDIKEALDKGDNNKAKQLLETFFAQQQMGMPIEYLELSNIYERLGDKKEAAKYRLLGEEAEKEFSTDF